MPREDLQYEQRFSVSKKPYYISDNIKKVSEIDLKATLKELKAKNKALRESMKIKPEHLNFICY